MQKQGKNARLLLMICQIISVVILIALMTPLANIRSGSILQHIDVIGHLDDKGDLHVEESHQYHLAKEKHLLKAISPFFDKNQSIEFLDIAINGVKSNYSIDDSQRFIIIKHPPKGKVDITYHYKLKCVVTQYQDIQVMDWHFFQTINEKNPDHIKLTLNFPKVMTEDQLKLFIHGKLRYSINYESQKLIVNIHKIYGDTFGEIALILPENPLKEIVKTVDKSILDQKINSEEAQQQLTETEIKQSVTNIKKDRSTFNRAIITAFICVVLFIILTILKFKEIYLKFDKEPYHPFIDYFREIPKQYSAMVARRILDDDFCQKSFVYQASEHHANRDVFIATLFDLYHKNYLDLSFEVNSDKKEDLWIKVLDKTPNSLFPEERYLYLWLKKEAENYSNQPFSYQNFFNQKEEYESRVFMRSFNRFLELGQISLEKLEYITFFGKHETIRFFFPWLMIPLVVALYFIIHISSPFNPLTIPKIGIIILIFLNMLGYFALFSYKRSCFVYTQEGMIESQKCHGLKRYLEDFTALNESKIMDVKLWQQYFVFALALGISEEALKHFYHKLPQEFMRSKTKIQLADFTDALKLINSLVKFLSNPALSCLDDLNSLSGFSKNRIGISDYIIELVKKIIYKR